MKLVNLRPTFQSTFAHKVISPVVAQFARRGAALIAPPVCALCAAAGQAAEGIWGMDLCEHCEAACPLLVSPCPRCALPGRPTPGRPTPGRPTPRSGAGPCADCTVRPPPYDAVVAAFTYDFPVDHMVRELKFHQELSYGRVLGQLLGRARRARSEPLPALVVPMPLHRSRYVARGFNQAEEIARHAARSLGLPFSRRVLQRRRATLEQSELDATARQHNVRGAFCLAKRPAAVCVALVDDVLTTGSTAAEAARVLKDGGATRVEVWVAARALPWRAAGE
ncbi:MAG: ComF family protein [Pseudomonadota bacterium]